MTNIPREQAGDIHSKVEGAEVRIFATKNGRPDSTLGMASIHIGDHMFADPIALREMYGRDTVAAIEKGREAGYLQARFDIRMAISARSTGRPRVLTRLRVLADTSSLRGPDAPLAT